ncbi:hypothetical protein RCL_jg6732.t1 [Rhizophagus clarus]|uniref:Uncharacterized protein n=1 Tax=Rhizophagus clarus TaxID=94130 RepID=A0A8H3LHD8_9GLOM|nr:hypothetical protein RCL_jg6732.t1 [Rhizophagus clarus]
MQDMRLESIWHTNPDIRGDNDFRRTIFDNSFKILASSASSLAFSSVFLASSSAINTSRSDVMIDDIFIHERIIQCYVANVRDSLLDKIRKKRNNLYDNSVYAFTDTIGIPEC